MERELDLSTASREVLLAIIAELQQRIETLEGKAKAGGPRGMPGLKPKADRKPAQPREPRKPRRHGFSRQRMTPTRRVEHALDSCPECGTGLAGGWAQRTREVIDIPAVPAQVTGHVFIARICPLCEQRRTPRADLAGVVLGKQRLGINLVSLIAALREEARLPCRTIQWYLQTVHQLSLSVGTLAGVIHRVARQAQGELGSIRGADSGQSGGARRRDRLAGERGQWVRLDLLHSHRTVFPAPGAEQGGGGRGAGRGLRRGAGQRLLRRLPALRRPQAALLGPPAAGDP